MYVYNMSAFHGIVIDKIVYEAGAEYVVFRRFYDGKYEKPRRNKLRYTAVGKAFFMSHCTRVYLDDFMKVEEVE